MYEAAAKVRKMSDADIISHADDIIKGNREFLTSRHPNRGPSNLTLDAKALLVAYNAALRSRLSDIINKKVPGLADDVIKKNPTETANRLRSMWPLAAALLLLLLALAKCNDGT